MYQPIIGLEIHIELNTKSKMFCSCLNDPNEKRPNVNVCVVCMGHPGTLPVINKQAVRKTIKTGLAFNCQISEYSKFDRKNYFYPDLPKGYQISQLYMPLCKEGFLKIDNLDRKSLASYGVSKKIRIREVHLEEDVGKLFHPVRGQRLIREIQRKSTSNVIHPEAVDYSLADFNRAGIPLMEMVTEPDITSAKQAREFAEELQLILRYLDVSGANMEKGQLRIEVNISLTKDIKKLGTKVEIKNLNSFRTVEKAIEYEIERQKKVLKSDKKVIQETRGWDEKRKITFSQRTKEEAHDYRYFPEPDLPILHLKSEKKREKDFDLDEIKREITELPQQKRKRFEEEYKLPIDALKTLVRNKLLANYFENVCSELPQTEYVGKTPLQKLYKLSSNYLITEIQKLLYQKKEKFKNLKITPENFAEFITLIEQGTVSSSGAQILLKEMFESGADPSHIIKEKDLAQLIDKSQIQKIVQEIILKNSKAIEDYRKGKKTAFQYLIGQAMAISKGKANPQIVGDILKKKLRKI